MIKVLPSVQPKILVIMAAINNAAEFLKLPEMYITAGSNGKHMQGSKHYSLEALDFRTHHLTSIETAALIKEIRSRLGPDYDVIFEDVGKENEHGHVEYDPKKDVRI